MRRGAWRARMVLFDCAVALSMAVASSRLSAQPAFTIDQKREILATVWEYRVRTTMDPAPLDPCSAYWAVLRDVDVLPLSIWPKSPIVLHPEPDCPPSLAPSPRAGQSLPQALVRSISAGLRTAPPRATVVLQVFHRGGAFFTEEYQLRYVDSVPGWRVTGANRDGGGVIDLIAPGPRSYLLIVDDVVTRATRNDSTLASIPPGSIASIRYLMPGDSIATLNYGSAASNGVLIITTRKPPRR